MGAPLDQAKRGGRNLIARRSHRTPCHGYSLPGAGVSGFTLIELLAVVGLLVVLAVLLISVVQGGIARARTVECLFRIKTVTSAMLSYADDHGKNLPPTWNAEEGITWMGAIGTQGGYLRPQHDTKDRSGFKIWRCPDWRPFRRDEDVAGAPYQTTYGFVAGGSGSFPGNLLKLESLSKTPLLADSIDETKKIPGYSYSQFYLVTPCKPTSAWKVHLRHQGKANMTFADGHCETLTKAGLQAMKIDGVPVSNWSTMRPENLD